MGDGYLMLQQKKISKITRLEQEVKDHKLFKTNLFRRLRRLAAESVDEAAQGEAEMGSVEQGLEAPTLTLRRRRG